MTGAPRSIGRAIALELADRGAAVAVHYHSRKAEADDTVGELRTRGAQALAFAADLSQVPAIGALFDEVEREFGGIHIVVANAGVTTAPTAVAEVSEDEFDRMLAVNTRSVFFVLREAARRVRDGGRIVNIGSDSAWNALPGFSAYATSKTGPITTVRILAKELGARGITANTVIAGPIADGFLAAAPAGLLDDLAAAAPAGRLGTPEDVAAVVGFLATAEAAWVTGQQLVVNGGSNA